MIELNDVKPYRKCIFCGDGTKADKEITIQTGQNSTTSLAVCVNHLEKFADKLEVLANESKLRKS
jgi:hypothetical protein